MRLPFFPKNILEKMRKLGISESQIIDVFNTGSYRTENGTKTASKKVGSLELGCSYDHNITTGEFSITDVWKR